MAVSCWLFAPGFPCTQTFPHQVLRDRIQFRQKPVRAFTLKSHRRTEVARGGVNPLTVFGFFAVTAMVVFYALEARSTHFILAFAVACVLGSVYGFLQGAWPFGAVELVWSGIALHRWRKTRIV